MDAARESGDLAAGYNQVYLTLALFAVTAPCWLSSSANPSTAGAPEQEKPV